VGGSRLLDVRDGDESGLVARLGLFELPVHRRQRALLGVEIVLGRQHVEIGLRDPGHQVLLRCLVVGFGLRQLGVGPLQGDPVLPAEQIELQIQAVLISRGGGRAGKRIREGLCRGGGAGPAGRGGSRRHHLGFIGRSRIPLPLRGARTVQLRQECRDRLGLRFERRQPGGLGLLELRIVLQGALVDREKVGGRRGRGSETRREASREQGR